ncbi:MAG: hypothetical protein ACJAT3_000678 [Akkermansiaceae bacterium]|jgi:hypothetical protein
MNPHAEMTPGFQSRSPLEAQPMLISSREVKETNPSMIACLQGYGN